MGRRKVPKKWRVVCKDGKPYHLEFYIRDTAEKQMDVLNKEYPNCSPHRLQVSDRSDGQRRTYTDEIEVVNET